MPKKHMSWGIMILILLHTLSLAYFIYMYFAPPPQPHVLVINLDDRQDKWQETQNEFKDWPTPIERLSAVKYTPGWKGCTMSHIKAIELAKKRHYPWVLIVEDDCVLTTEAKTQFQRVLPYLWKHKHRFDVFLGGVTEATKYKKPIVISRNPPMFQVEAHTTHFCLIPKESYNKILNHMPKDPNKMTIELDSWYRQHLRLWVTVPFIAIQRPGHSDIQDKTEDYTQRFKDSETALLQLVNDLNHKHKSLL